jgi:hypothetical protein
MRVPWVSVALLIVLGLLGWFSVAAWGDDPEAGDAFETPLLIVGWIGVGGSLVVGALGLWARAPATLATALGIVGAGAFAVAWMTKMLQDGGGAVLHAVVALAFISVVVAFAASARRPA